MQEPIWTSSRYSSIQVTYHRGEDCLGRGELRKLLPLWMNEACRAHGVGETRCSGETTNAEGETSEGRKSLVSCKDGIAAPLILGASR